MLFTTKFNVSKKYIILLSLFSSIMTFAQINTQKSKTMNDIIKFNEVSQFGYSEYVEIDLGTSKMLILSGQLALDAYGNTVGLGNFEQQAEYIFSSIKKILEKAGGSTHDIVKLNNYFTDISNLPLYRIIRNKYINTVKPPAQTSVEVKQLFRKDVLLEVEITAIIKK
ncbi:Rid family hydrolase [Flavobacterium sp. Root186]|uniref:Rid family hydrolase n=1 Tax=Flavobacterium sp. Root186 TaxID=1736485 RepID=UPI000A64C1AD|nr:RidA family protein [Flavobacterium sp. Root186]